MTGSMHQAGRLDQPLQIDYAQCTVLQVLLIWRADITRL